MMTLAWNPVFDFIEASLFVLALRHYGWLSST